MVIKVLISRYRNKAHGYGIHIWKNGDRYEGEWQNSLKHGKGNDIFASGDTYLGQYYKGKPFGNGTYTWINGNQYTGQFKNGLKHGRGKWIKSTTKVNSNKYDGEYFMDKKHGYGVFKWQSGNTYKGQYKEDQRHGYGEMYWTDGSVYKGEWIKGIQHGYGEMIFPDGNKKIGIFDNNTFVAASDLPDSHFEQIDKMKTLNVSHKSRDHLSLDTKLNNSLPIISHSRKTSIERDQNDLSTLNPPKRIKKPISTKHRIVGSRGRVNPSPRRFPKVSPRDAKTNYGSRRTSPYKTPSLDRLNQTTSSFSFVDENVKAYALNVINRRKRRMKKRLNSRPVWRPTGNIHRKDGYSILQKMYY